LYLSGLLGETERKNVWAIASSIVNGNYHSLHHFIHDAPWSADEVNCRRLEILQGCRQTKLKYGFDLILDDSGHRKSGSATDGVGRQYIGQIGKVDNGIVTVTSHGFDGIKGVPIDIELYKHASSLEKGKEDPEFQKKPDIAIGLINKCLEKGLSPGLVLLETADARNMGLRK
jgi:SRSO17 transposase